jgi:DNA-binding Lrp family transcriptional regulator
MSLYPFTPGYKDADTSKEAAEAIAPKAAHYRRAVMEAFRRAGWGGLTADEAAEALNLDILTVRPRVSELKALDLIEDTGARHENQRSGKRAKVMRDVLATPPGGQCELFPKEAAQ